MPRSQDEQSPPLTQQAEALWLSSLSELPAAWRSRATSTAGLLSAAAAATLAGLLLKSSSQLSSALQYLVPIAAVCFVLAVVLLLVAGILPPPADGPLSQENKSQFQKTNDGADPDFVEAFETYARREAKPLRSLTIAGSIFGVAAVIFTVWSAVLLTKPTSYLATVQVIQLEDRRAIASICAGITFPASGVIKFSNPETTIFDPDSDHCPADVRTISLPTSSIVIARR